MKDEDGAFEVPVNMWPLCRFCRHLYNIVGPLTCAAFPRGIPQEVLSGAIIHNRPLAGQENNIVLTPW